ncbi:unnamed protein product [Brachionus calyciflorus]|uniref:Macro domain-containing protein n=1 Tax=Brachionus calyciflorus TaxID=104777 RepID=A0A814PGV0_9BILA|nr:unnamed protein product [Brachionus calyciflorus]
MDPKFSFSFLFDSNLFAIFANDKKLVEFNLNIINNNLNVNLDPNAFNHPNELVYLIIDHLNIQQPTLNNFKNYLKLSPQFKSNLNSFIYKQYILQFENKLTNALSLKPSNSDIQIYWSNLINKQNLSTNKSEIENLILLSDINNEVWTTRMNSLKHKQQRQFSKFLFKLYDEFKNGKKAMENLDEYVEKNDFDDFDNKLMGPVKLLDGTKTKRSSRVLKDTSFNRIEESYTIQLGAQLKSTHNLRLIRCDILDYCKDRFKYSTENNLDNCIEPHSMLNSMSLYSQNKLNALVLLVDNLLINSKSFQNEDADSFDVSQSFREICQKNGYDFHFKSIDEQIEEAIKMINRVNKVENEDKYAKLNIGDFYVTKHSNLSQTHVVFNLATIDKEDENSHMKKSDLSSRHPVILGLRNILKTCIQNNVHTITFPLLLSHQMTEEMTVNWVMKRAELVLKCMKGFMIEFVQWGAQESRNIQFVVPLGLNDETFSALSSLIKTIFRESRTYLLD